MSKEMKFLNTTAILGVMLLSACTIPATLPSIGNPLKNPNIPDAGTIVSSPSTPRNVKTIIAAPGDTMMSLATKAGVSTASFAAANGLPTSYLPQTGQSFLVPSVTPTIDAPKTDIIETTSIGEDTNNSTKHRVKAGETAYSIARLYGVSVTSLSSWNKLGPELAVSEGQELIIPLNATPNSVAPSTQVASTTPSVTTDAGTSSFQKPVSGTISTPYDPSKNSDGVVYTTSSSASVKASSGGKVVLVSESTGSNGTIVMIQHPNGLISVYGKLGKASVSKGQQVNAGETIGTTANDQLLFQLRKGTESVNPGDYV